MESRKRGTTDGMESDSVRYHCPACGKTFGLDTPLWRCPCGKSHLNLTPGRGLRRTDIDTSRRSLWRYQAALPVKGPPAITLGEGWTPLIDGSWDGHPILYKLDYLMPTGSFKDRGVAVMVNYLKQHGITAIANDSSGNGGASLAAYAAAATMPCRILVPASTSRSKIIQIAVSGVEVVLIEGSREDVADAALREAERSFYASHNWQAMFLEGTKTLGYELWEGLDFQVPDNIVVPVGGGSNVLGSHLAFSELLRRGEIDRLPRIFGVQAAHCAPVHAAFEAGADDPVPIAVKATVAEGIALRRPVRLREVVNALRATHGGTVAVAEEQILAAVGALARSGLFVEPTSAAAAAGLTRLFEAGEIKDGETTVVVLTGSGLKAAESIGDALGLPVSAQ